jgi:hypothetical protein
MSLYPREQNLPGLTPKSSFIATEAVEAINRQIAKRKKQRASSTSGTTWPRADITIVPNQVCFPG